MVWLAAVQIFVGLLFVSWALDGIAKQMKRQNKLREAELRARGIAVDEPVDQEQAS